MPERKLEGHRGRLREKFLEHGLDKFTDDEIVELLLTLATPRRDCKQTARDALKEFGGLAKTLETPIEDLQKITGIGPTNALGVALVQQIARKFLREKIIKGDYVNSFSDALDYFHHAMKASGEEAFHVLYLNSQNAILGEERFSSGLPGSVAVSPRRLVESAIKLSATSLVMAHNHPGGSAAPSKEDIQTTQNLYFSLRFLELSLRDHLIITPEAHYSFHQEGLMARFEKDFKSLEKKMWK